MPYYCQTPRARTPAFRVRYVLGPADMVQYCYTIGQYRPALPSTIYVLKPSLQTSWNS